jgi:hypothetical protein
LFNVSRVYGSACAWLGSVCAGVVCAGVVFAGVVFAGVVFAGVVFAGLALRRSGDECQARLSDLSVMLS